MKFGSVLLTAALALAMPAGAYADPAPSLRGSAAGMQVQNRVAKEHGLAFYRTEADIRDAIDSGQLVELVPNENFDVADFVSIPYADPAVVLFVERLSKQYREACGQRLVVTSAVRAAARQPPNAHALSVHPAGMAVDLRVSDRAACREWLENAILGMEKNGLVDGIREYNPPHYHVAIFPSQYTAYAMERAAEEAAREAELQAEREAALAAVEIPLPAATAMLVADTRTEESGASSRVAGVLAILFALGAIPLSLAYRARNRSRG